MGCDIHVYLERDLLSNAKVINFWLWAEIYVARDYRLFGYMAGVRGDEQMFEARGLPDKLSFDVRKAFKDWEGDAHGISWLILAELKQIAAAYPNNDLLAIIAMMEVYDRYGYQQRLIFWFDN